ncbi:MAG TPA: hypothetical protein VGB66_06125, partial [Longimicrobium sp.]
MNAAGEAEARAFVEDLQARAAPLQTEANLAWWEAATGGGDAALERSARARSEYRALFSDPVGAARVRGWLASFEVREPLLRRQLQLLDYEFTPNQLPRDTIDDLVARTADLERTFYGFRAEIGGERVTNNRIVDILEKENDSAVRRDAWSASKQVGS